MDAVNALRFSSKHLALGLLAGLALLSALALAIHLRPLPAPRAPAANAAADPIVATDLLWRVVDQKRGEQCLEARVTFASGASQLAPVIDERSRPICLVLTPVMDSPAPALDSIGPASAPCTTLTTC